jgi:hypothetical protein
MYVHEQTRPTPSPIPGLDHATWAGSPTGLSQLSLWRQNVAPGAATPPHRHDCEEIVLCSGGWGELHIAGEVHRFGADTTLNHPAQRAAPDLQRRPAAAGDHRRLRRHAGRRFPAGWEQTCAAVAELMPGIDFEKGDLT